MPTIAGYPYVKAEFDENGKPTNKVTLPSGLTDIIIFSHGWNNNAAEAQALYTKFFENFRDLPPDTTVSARQIGVIGVFWPSKRFDETVAVEGDGAMGGAASLGSRASTKALAKRLDAMAKFFVSPAQKKALKELKTLLPDLEDKATARAKFLRIIRESVLDKKAANKEDASTTFFKDDPEDVMKRLRIASAALQPDVAAASGATALPTSGKRHSTEMAGAAGLKEILSGFGAAAMNVLNYATYFEMKKRASAVGSTGVAALIDALPAEIARVHLVGHSFGARVVTAAAQNSRSKKIASLSLLQAAFSHNGFSKQMEGAFRAVVDKKRISGPIIVTHSRNDRAVGLAYPLASRLAGDMTAAFGDETDKFGGLGRNGVQQMGTNERVVGELLSVGQPYSFKPGIFFNLEGKGFITGHGTVTGKEIAYAVQRAIAVT
jgi:predicted alpha/beta hydrolase family esterase